MVEFDFMSFNFAQDKKYISHVLNDSLYSANLKNKDPMKVAKSGKKNCLELLFIANCLRLKLKSSLHKIHR